MKKGFLFFSVSSLALLFLFGLVYQNSKDEEVDHTSTGVSTSEKASLPTPENTDLVTKREAAITPIEEADNTLASGYQLPSARQLLGLDSASEGMFYNAILRGYGTALVSNYSYMNNIEDVNFLMEMAKSGDVAAMVTLTSQLAPTINQLRDPDSDEAKKDLITGMTEASRAELHLEAQLVAAAYDKTALLVSQPRALQQFLSEEYQGYPQWVARRTAVLVGDDYAASQWDEKFQTLPDDVKFEIEHAAAKVSEKIHKLRTELQISEGSLLNEESALKLAHQTDCPYTDEHNVMLSDERCQTLIDNFGF